MHTHPTAAQVHRSHLAVHAVWWLLHVLGLALVLVLPTDLRRSLQSQAGPWQQPTVLLLGLVLGLNVLTYCTLRKKTAGQAPAACLGEAACHLCGCRTGPGTVHCRLCRHCVDGFDHHCLWAGVCISTVNHAEFCRFVATQAAVTALGFHHALTALGRPGGDFAVFAMVAFGLMTAVLGLLCAAHTGLTVLGMTSRQVVTWVRRWRPGKEAAVWHRPSLGLMLQNLVHIACCMRPQWLVSGAFAQEVEPRLGRLLHNEHYSCCC